MSDVRFTYEPLLDLADGLPAGIEVQRCFDRDRTLLVGPRVVWGPRQLAEFDAGIAVTSVLHETGYDATVPVHVDLSADAVVAARHRVAQLPDALRQRLGGLPAPPIVLEIGPAVAAAPPDALAEGIAELRAAGFGIAFDGVGRAFGLDLVAELRPALVKLDPALVARLPTDPCAAAVVRAVCDVATVCEVTVSAVGVTHRDELAALRDHGVTRAQGPLLAAARRRPATAGITVPVELMQQVQAVREPAPPVFRMSLPTVASLAQQALVLPDDVSAELARTTFAAHPQAGSLVLADADRRPTGFLDRNRFMLALSGPYGHALYARRPVRGLAEPPRTIGITTDVPTALEYCVSDRTRCWDDLVLLDGALRCAGIVRTADLLQVATGARSGTGSVA